METTKYGIIGCGGHALLAHAIPGKSIPELQLMCVYDISSQIAANFCHDYGSALKVHGEIDELLASDIDAVLIASPDEVHLEQLRAAIMAGKHVLVEKPLAMKYSDLEDMDSLLLLAASRGLVVTSCHPRRFDPPFIWLKNRIKSAIEEFGPVVSFSLDFSYHRPEAEWKADRSLMMDHLNHEIDLLHFFFGVTSFSAKLWCDSFNHYFVTGQRDDGISFSFNGTRRLESKIYREWLTLRHDHGEIRIDTYTGRAFALNHEDSATDFSSCGKTDYPTRSIRVMRNFVETIQGISTNYLTLQDLGINNWLGATLKEFNEATFLDEAL